MLNITNYFLIYFLTSVIGIQADIECEEYSKFVYAEEHSPVLHVEATKESVSKCGIVEVPLIIGGVKASAKEFPHMAVIGFGNNANEKDLAWHCGGTLISEQFILTAAHCLEHVDKGNAQRVRIGAINLKSIDPQIVQDIKIIERISHPEYAAKTKYNDLALLKLEKKVRFNEMVRPACLNTDKHFKWTRSLATGFGRLAYDDTEGSSELMKVQLSNISEKDCQESYKTNRAISDGILPSQFCAGEMAGKKDTCQGDSGGPLQVVLDKPYCMYSIIGITSFGKFCGFENSPGVYTRVAHFIDWIERHVWK